MIKHVELAGIVGPLAFFRHPIREYSDYLYYVGQNWELVLTRWKELPTENQVADFLGVPPWDDTPVEIEPPILSYLQNN